MTTRDGAQAGMEQAAEHAEQVRPGWNERAYAAFREFARVTPLFRTEDARLAAYEAGLERPPTDRAWGGIAQRAMRDGIVRVERMSMSQHGPANTGYRPLYRSLVLMAAAALDPFHDHVYFAAEKSAKGWAVYYEPKPRRNPVTGSTTYGLRVPAFLTWEGLEDIEGVTRRTAEVLNRHWEDRS